MNEKFFSLPAEKQERMLNAGFRVFSQSAYAKSPMGEIAAAAGISKSLLFHYFQNKKSLYLFLWDQAAKITVAYMKKHRCYDSSDLFMIMERGMRAKIQIMLRYPDMAAFTIKAFYEKDKAIAAEIGKSYRKHLSGKAVDVLSRLNPEDFTPGLDLTAMYRHMYLAAEGYLWEIVRSGGALDADKLEEDFSGMITFWKSVYQRRG